MSDEVVRPHMQVLLPTFSGEVADALVADGRPDLAEQLSKVRVWGRCGCGDDFCSSFYTGPRPNGTWYDCGEYTNAHLIVCGAMVNLDVVDGLIRYIEVLDRPDVKTVVDALPIVARPRDPAE